MLITPQGQTQLQPAQVKDFLLTQVEALTGVAEGLDPDLALMELGIDSVRLISLLEALRQRGVMLGFTDVMEMPSLRSLEASVCRLLSNCAFSPAD